MFELANEIVNSAALQQVVYSLTDDIVAVCLPLAGGFFLIRLAWAFATSVFAGSKFQINGPGIMQSFVTGLIIILVLQIYKPVVGTMDALLMSFQITLREKVETDDFKELLNKQELAYDQAVNGNQHEDTWDWNIIQSWGEGLSKGVATVFQNVFSMIAAVISTLMFLIAFLTTRAYFLMGPIALLFTLIPAYKNQFGTWFQGFVNGYATMVVLVLFDALINAISGTVTNLWDGGQQVDVWALTLLNLLVIVFYLGAPKFASHMMGQTDVGASVNHGLAAATGVATTAVTAGVNKLSSLRSGKGSSGEGNEGVADAAESLLGGAK